VAGELCPVADVDAGEVHDLERTHGVSEGGAAGDVDVLDARDALLEQEDRFVAQRVEDPVGDEAGDLLAQHHRLLAELLHQRDDRVDGGVGRGRPAHDLDAAHDQRRVEEVHVGDAARAAGGVGELRGHDRRGVRGEDRVRRCGLVEPGEDLPLDLQLLDRGLDHQVRAGRGGVEVGAEREARERGVDVGPGAPALRDVAVQPRAQRGLRPRQGLVRDVGGRGVVAGQRAHHRDLRAHRAGAHDKDPVHGHTPLKVGGRFSRNALAPSALSAVV
jgi:hypothetical protein